MKMTSARSLVNCLLAGLMAAGCGGASRAPVARQAGAATSPAPESRLPLPAADSGPALPAAPGGVNPGDVHFMQRMIAHHAQALAMTALVPSRGARPELATLGERIAISQRDEIAMMRRWLTERGQAVPDVAAGHAAMQHGDMHNGDMQHGDMHDGDMHHDPAGADAGLADAMKAPMPGMATAEEMARLAGATGPRFDDLFLQLMIRHHEGAVKMVADFFSTRGAGQEPEIFRFASDVDADQRAEIARMRALLASASPH